MEQANIQINQFCDYKSLQAGEKNIFHVLIQIVMPPYPSKKRIPLNLALVLDRSGSMSGRKIEEAKLSCQSFVRWMTRHDILSLIAYDSEVETIVSAVKLSDKEPILARIQGITPGANTNLSGGWIEAIRQIESVESKEYFRRVILLTDGQANEGITEPEKLIGMAKKYYDKGISLTTIGYGADFDEKLLSDLAQYGGGNFHYIRTEKEAPNIFFEEFGNISSLIGQNGVLEMEFDPHVKVAEILSTSPFQKKDDHHLEFTIGDILAESIFQVLLVLEADLTQTSDSEIQLYTARASYFDVGSIEFVEKTAGHAIKVGKAEKSRHTDLIYLESVIARKSKMVLEAVELTEEGKDEQAAILLTSAMDLLEKNRHLDEKKIDAEIENLKYHINILQNRSINEFRKTAQATHTIDLSIEPPLPGSAGARNVYVKPFNPNTELDLYNAPEIREYLYELTNRGEGFSVIFDMKNVKYIDSSGIGALISSYRNIRQKGGILVLARLNKQLQKIFELSRLDSFFKIFDSIEEAKNFIKSGGENKEKGSSVTVD